MIKQAIIPLAGLGTRLLPLSSVIPKELLPLHGKPNLEYILEECVEAGIKEFIFVISELVEVEKKITKKIIKIFFFIFFYKLCLIQLENFLFYYFLFLIFFSYIYFYHN